MNGLLGCFFILIFGVIFIFIGLGRMFFQLLFGGGLNRTHSSGTGSDPYGNRTAQNSRQTYTSGNAHHERNRANSRQRRSGKIFEKNEGEYVDFEEV